jgi:hypothetical protein
MELTQAMNPDRVWRGLTNRFSYRGIVSAQTSLTFREENRRVRVLHVERVK